MKKYFLLGLFFSASIYFWGCSTAKEVASSWNDKKIIVDGNQEDWQGKLKYDANEGIAYGFTNDNDNLYFCFTTGSRARIFQMIRNGFIVWFKPTDGEGKTIGIKYPVGITEFDREMPKENDPQKIKEDDNRVEKMIAGLPFEQNEMLILNKEKFPLTSFPLQNKAGIEIKFGYKMQQMVLEMKVPFMDFAKSEYSVNAKPGDIIKVGLQTEERDEEQLKGKDEKPGQGRGEPGSGGFGGGTDGDSRGKGRRGMGGGLYGGPGKGVIQKIELLDYWIKLSLQKAQ